MQDRGGRGEKEACADLHRVSTPTPHHNKGRQRQPLEECHHTFVRVSVGDSSHVRCSSTTLSATKQRHEVNHISCTSPPPSVFALHSESITARWSSPRETRACESLVCLGQRTRRHASAEAPAATASTQQWCSTRHCLKPSPPTPSAETERHSG